jgi:hypothetical protein
MNGLPRRPVDTPKCAAERDVLAPLAEFARSLAELVLGEGLSPYQPPCGIGDPPSTAGTSGERSRCTPRMRRSEKPRRSESLTWGRRDRWCRRQWESDILEQIPDQLISWATTEGATNAGTA